MNASKALRCDRLAAAEARRFVDEALDLRPLIDDEQREVLHLLVSELVTNAVLHTSGPVHLHAEVLADDLWVGVTDQDPDCPTPTRPKEGQTGGFGLWLLEELSHSWGIQARGPAGGKTVWFTLPVRLGAGDRRSDEPPLSAEAP